MAPHAPSSSTFEGSRRAPRPAPTRRTGILATDARSWSPLSFPTRRPPSKCGGLQEVSRAPVNKALLIGIQYETNNDFSNLLLAHKDVEMVKDMLINLYHFESKNIVVLSDDNEPGTVPPTRDMILREIRVLMQNVQAGDQLYFHYSGHGEQVKCVVRDPTDDDGMDECIVPCDAKYYDSATWIVDNLLNDMLVKTLPVGAYLMAVFDMCHAGTALDLMNYYYAQEGTFIRRCTRRFTNFSRHVSKAFSLLSSRSSSRTRHLQTSDSQQRVDPPRKDSTDKLEKCLVITSERLSSSKVKSRKLTVSIDTSPSPPKSTRERLRQFSMSKSEKVYKLEHHLMDITGAGPSKLPISASGAPSIREQRAAAFAESERRLSKSHIAQAHFASAKPLVFAQPLKRPSTFPRPQISENTVLDKDCGPFDFIPRLFRSFTDEHHWRTRDKLKVKVDKEWNVFSSGGLKKRKHAQRAVLIETKLPLGTVVMDETRTLRPITLAEKTSTDTILPLGYIFESPPGSPVTSIKSGNGGRRAEEVYEDVPSTGQVVSIGAAADAQMAMEYACKDKDNKYKLKSLTATLVEILYENPHPTLANLMVHLGVWLKNSSEEMHKHYERRRDYPPPFPSTPDEQAMHIFENGVEAMVLEERPVQEPVLGLQNRTDINEAIFLPFSQRRS